MPDHPSRYALKRKEVREAIARARKLELEEEPIQSKEEALRIYKEGISLGEQLKKALRPSWFVS